MSLTRRCRGVAAIAMTSVSMTALFAATAETRKPTLDVILSNLPPSNSAKYASLYDAAGRPKREVLEMTGAEVWTISSDRWDAVRVAGAKAGAGLSKLGTAWNHALVPMAKSATMSAAQHTLMNAATQSHAVVGATVMAVPPPALAEHMLTKGMDERSSSKNQPHLIIPIADGKVVTARRTSVRQVPGGYAWHGAVEETGEPVTVLWWPSGRMAGSVTYYGRVFSIHDLGGGMNAVVEMSPSRMPQEHAPMGIDMMKKMHLEKDPLVTKGDPGVLMDNHPKSTQPDSPVRPEQPARDLRDAQAERERLPAPGPLDIIHSPLPAEETRRQATIRLVVAYTKAAAFHYSDIKIDLIPLAIEDANESFRMSGITNVKLELAYAYQTNYVESGSHFDHVFRFAGKNDGYMDEVHALRDKYKADVGVLIVDDPHGCGLSAGVHVRVERAFAVVHHECAANMYSLAHEIGHIIGARHDEALDDSKQPFAFGHGYVLGKRWRTMMAYKDTCDGCPRVPVWSSPRIVIRGLPAGNAESDNARVIAENAARVAAFR